MITADNLVKTFTRNEKKNKKSDFNAVDGISLSVKEGEIVGILGPNGAGKTTLLRMMSKLMKPTGGMVSIRIGGQEISDDIEVKRHIGYLSNNTKLYGRLSTRELMQMLGVLYGVSEEDTRRRIDEISEVLSMESFIDNRIEKLSTGQTQRASIARCLVHDPRQGSSPWDSGCAVRSRPRFCIRRRSSFWMSRRWGWILSAVRRSLIS